MSKISALYIAIEKLDEAEEALLDVRNAFSVRTISHPDHKQDPDYKLIDAIFENVGDYATTLRHILSSLEKDELSKMIEEK